MEFYKYKDMLETNLDAEGIDESFLKPSQKDILNGAKYLHNYIQSLVLDLDNQIADDEISDIERAVVVIKRESYVDLLDKLIKAMKELIISFARDNNGVEQPSASRKQSVLDYLNDLEADREEVVEEASSDGDEPVLVEDDPFEEQKPLENGEEEIELPEVVEVGIEPKQEQPAEEILEDTIEDESSNQSPREDLVKACFDRQHVCNEMVEMLESWDKRYVEFYRMQEQLFLEDGYPRGSEKTSDDYVALYQNHPEFASAVDQFNKDKDTQLKTLVTKYGEEPLRYALITLYAGKDISTGRFQLLDETYKDDLSNLVDRCAELYAKLSTELGEATKDFYGNAYKDFYKESPKALLNWLRTGIRSIKNGMR